MATRSSLRRDDGETATAVALRSSVDRGRIGVYAALGASVGALPLPWLPDSLVRRVRGALVHDVAVRHGVSLSSDARDVLAEPAGPDGPRGLVAQAVRFFGLRLAGRVPTRLRPAGFLC